MTHCDMSFDEQYLRHLSLFCEGFKIYSIMLFNKLSLFGCKYIIYMTCVVGWAKIGCKN
jgi:hypothetical protein